MTVSRSLLAVALLAGAVVAQAQKKWPTRPITIVVPASPGGAIDITARLVGARLSQTYGVPVTIDNKAGATGILGSDAVAKAAPDGHTLPSSRAATPSTPASTPSCRSTP